MLLEHLLSNDITNHVVNPDSDRVVFGVRMFDVVRAVTRLGLHGGIERTGLATRKRTDLALQRLNDAGQVLTHTSNESPGVVPYFPSGCTVHTGVFLLHQHC